MPCECLMLLQRILAGLWGWSTNNGWQPSSLRNYSCFQSIAQEIKQEPLLIVTGLHCSNDCLELVDIETVIQSLTRRKPATR